jgi:large subunit ribosomal protein L3
MIKAIIGKKQGMTQYFTADGMSVPVTVVLAGPCVVVSKRTAENDGYDAVQIAISSKRSKRSTNKAVVGHFKKAGLEPLTGLREIRGNYDLAPGAPITVANFKDVAKVDIIGVSKGRGFQGTVKRHHFSGGAGSHGSMHNRQPGSIGSNTFPGRVIKGKKLAGHMGDHRITVKNLKVVAVDEEKNLLLLKGSVPGALNALLIIQQAKSAGGPA